MSADEVTLAERLNATADQLQATVDRIYEMARNGDAWMQPGSDPHLLLDHNGRPLLAEPLAALGQVLAALAHLQPSGAAQGRRTLTLGEQPQ